MADEVAGLVEAASAEKPEVGPMTNAGLLRGSFGKGGVGCLLVLLLWGAGCTAGSTPAARIAQLPSRAPDEDYVLQAKLFSELENLGKQHLRRGMPKAEVVRAFGPPKWVWAAFQSKSGRAIEIWSYMASISGTVEYWLVFVNGVLDFFGANQATALRLEYEEK
ncbi:MAG: hypothetical protein HY002_15090 [Candidatus Rokubacteria bacterium]|nr:hypothetical protein [Candidatus Rokubacteria bacterium]